MIPQQIIITSPQLSLSPFAWTQSNSMSTNHQLSPSLTSDCHEPSFPCQNPFKTPQIQTEINENNFFTHKWLNHRWWMSCTDGDSHLSPCTPLSLCQHSRLFCWFLLLFETDSLHISATWAKGVHQPVIYSFSLLLSPSFALSQSLSVIGNLLWGCVRPGRAQRWVLLCG